MKIETFALERWMTTWEMKVEFDLTESGILPQSVNDLLAFEPTERRTGVLAEPVLGRPAG